MSQSHEDMTRIDDEAPITDGTTAEGETHATTGGAAAAGAVTGGVIGLAGGPAGAAIGAVGGAIIGAAAERLMHSDDEAEHTDARLDTENTPVASGPTAGEKRGQRVERVEADEEVDSTPPAA